MDTAIFAWTPQLMVARDFFIALFIGVLIGFERERHAEGRDPTFGGLRTFVLCALLGALAGWLDAPAGTPWLLVAGLLVLCVMLAVGLILESRDDAGEPGMTTEISALVTYLLGGAVTRGHAGVAVMLAIAVLALLAFKQPLHGIVRAVDREDMIAGLKLLAASFIVLPLLPDSPIDPWGALNPYRLWLLVVLISTLSLVGYVAVRLLGPRRGFTLTGVFGGLVSSTAVTMSFARQSRHAPSLEGLVAMGTLLAWTIMLVRVVVEVMVVNRALLVTLAAPLAAMFVVSVIAVAWFAHAAGRHGTSGTAAGRDLSLKNPFSLTSAINFALLFALVLLVVRFVQLYVPDEWLYAVAALAGATDVDAITLSVAGAARDGLAERLAVLSILVAVWSNTLAKCALVFVLGSHRVAARLAIASVAAIAAGAATFLASG